MRRWFKRFAYTFVGFIPLFFLAMFLATGFPEGSFLSNIGDGLGVAAICTAPLVALLATITGIGTLIERFTNQDSGEKQKREFSGNFQADSPELQRILNRLSASDREYLEDYLAARRLGLADDGEMMSLEDLIHDADDDIKALFTG